ncbi:hypothetical protein [Aneurinibacillus thermoaerophilus]|uniref:hypothetical protein n=1 Tax=Aneurinibacillus thermoaerophilus TaxID=143495 RepID=UPI002E1CB72D|nr:hypothetical protein [Aneurinibacillus thermoaerophilus]
MNIQNHYRIETVFTLLQPLSHIGESESTQSFLNTTTVINEGIPVEVFFYSGNALRGMLRDCGARYLLDKLGIQVPLKTFHLLFSGGSIGGDQNVDIDQSRLLRKTLPFLSVFGGGVGNQILDGKIKQTHAYPICKETNGILPSYLEKSEFSWRQLSGDVQFSRKDDEKNENLRPLYLHAPDEEQKLLEGETEKKKKKSDGPATQMRYAVEYMAAGNKLWHRFDLICEEVELGAFVSAIHEWQKQPYLGGMAGKGFGLVAADMELITEEGRQPFAQIGAEYIKLGPVAKQAKQTYDTHLKDIYDAYLLENSDNLINLLEGAKK